MKKFTLAFLGLAFSYAGLYAQSCAIDAQITTADSSLCFGDSTTLIFPSTVIADNVSTPIVNNNGQDGNMFDITAAATLRILSFEGNIANTPNPVTEYYMYYKTGTHVGFENNSSAWTLIAGPVSVTANAPNTLTPIPINVNIVIPAGQTYAFYLTNTSAISNNNRYHTGTATGAVAATNSDITVLEGTGGAYPFGTFFNARPWEGKVNYEIIPDLLWSTNETTSNIIVQPAADTEYSITATFPTRSCSIQDTISLQVDNPTINLGNDTAVCDGNTVTLDAGPNADSYLWCNGNTTQTVNANTSDLYCVTVDINGCTDSDTVMVIINPLPPIQANATDSVICQGESITLTGSGGGFYSWNNGVQNGVSFIPATSGEYVVLGSDNNLCTNTDTIQIVVNNNPTVNLGNNIVQVNPPVMLDAGNGFVDYDWSTSQITQTISVNTNGTYSVTVTDVNGCQGSDSISVAFTAGIENTNGTQANINLFPSPADDVLQISINNLESDVIQISLLDVKGTVLQTNNTSVFGGNYLHSVDVSTLASGVYIVRIQAGKSSQQIRFAKK